MSIKKYNEGVSAGWWLKYKTATSCGLIYGTGTKTVKQGDTCQQVI